MMARLGMVAAFGFLAFVAGCDSNGENSGKTSDAGAAVGGAGAGGTVSASGGSTSGLGGKSIAGATAMGGLPGSGGSAATAANGGSTGASLATSIGGVAATGGSPSAGGNVNGAGATGVQLGGGAGGVSGSGTCNYPACLYDLFSACPAAPTSASCTIQETISATSHQTNACYGDGSAATSIMDLTTYAATATFKRGGVTCYTMETSVAMSGLGVPTSTTITLKNGSGHVVATEVWDVAMDQTTVTCTGERPVILNADCDATSDGTYNCQPGVCNP